MDEDDLNIDDLDWSDINKHGEEHPEHLYEEYELDQIQLWMRSYLDGVNQSEGDLPELVGQVCLPNLVDDPDWITVWAEMLGNAEFDSWLAKGPHRNRQCQLSPIHLMGAALKGQEKSIAYRHEYYATWLPEIGITVISVYSTGAEDIYHNALALGYIDGPYSDSKANDIMSMLHVWWQGYTDDISQWESHYDDDYSPCGTECLFNNDLVSEYLFNETKA